MFFEIFILAIVNELYFRRLETPAVIEEGERRLQAKAQQLKEIAATQNPNDPPFLISDFGTRRRYTLAWQEHVIRTLLEAAPDIVRGTSNVYLAKKLGITPTAPWRTSSSKPFKPWTYVCVISKKPRWKAGYTNTAATSVSH